MAILDDNQSVTIEIQDPAWQDGKPKIPNHPYDIRIVRKTTSNGQTTEKILQVITVYPNIYLWIVGGYLLLSALIVVTGIMGLMSPDSENILENIFHWGGLQIVALVLYTLLSISKVAENERGGLLFFGMPVREMQPGIVFHPYGLLELKTLPRNPMQVQFPSDPERVFKSGDKAYFALPKEEQMKYVLPIRATTGKAEGRTSHDVVEGDVLNTQMTLEVTFYVRWSIEQFWVFLIRLGDREEANRQFRDSGERVIIQEIAKRTPGKVIEELSQINQALAERFEHITEDSGIKVDETAMLSPDINHEVNAELRNIATIKAKAVQTVVSAEAARVEIYKKGEGEATAKALYLGALAKGAQGLKVSGQDILDLEKATAMANGKATIIVDGGSAAQSLVGIGARFGIGQNQADRINQEASKGEA